MKIVFTKHALQKFRQPSVVNLKIRKEHVKSAIESPDYSGRIEERRVLYVIKKLDTRHNLRVIYRIEDVTIIVVTFYPTERGRYEQTKN